VTSRVESAQSAQTARILPRFSATLGHGRARGFECFGSYFPSLSVSSASSLDIKRQSILHAACSDVASGFDLNLLRILSFSRSYSAFWRITIAARAAIPAPRSATRANPPRGRPPSPSPRALLFLFEPPLENFFTRAFAFRVPFCGRTPFRAPGTYGGIARNNVHACDDPWVSAGLNTIARARAWE